MNWKLWCFVVLLLPLLVGLGVWQLQRAGEKERALAAFEEQLQQPAIVWQEDNEKGPPIYALAELQGNYSHLDWLLDNQVHQGRFGYRVFTPFCTSTFCVVVDRGWVPGSFDRQQLPELSRPGSPVLIDGRIDALHDNPMVGQDEPQRVSPFRVQQINLTKIAAELPLPLANRILRLSPEQPGVYTQNWQPVITGPEKHYGYAVQWFCMATVLLGLALWLQFRSGNTPPGPQKNSHTNDKTSPVLPVTEAGTKNP